MNESKRKDGDREQTCVEAWGNKKETRTCARCGKPFECYDWTDRRYCNVVCQLDLDGPDTAEPREGRKSE